MTPPDEPISEAREVGADLILAAASAIPIAGRPLASYYQAMTNHKLRKQLKFLEDVVASLGERIENVAQVVTSDPAKLDLLTHGADQAAQVPSGSDVLPLIAEVVVKGVIDGDTNLAFTLIDVLGQLSADHLRVLQAVSTSRVLSGDVTSYRDVKGMDLAAARRWLPELDDVAEPLVARLVALGLVHKTTEPPELNRQFKQEAKPQRWGVTLFGLKLLDAIGAPLTGHDEKVREWRRERERQRKSPPSPPA
jgi:hypothetical protein